MSQQEGERLIRRRPAAFRASHVDAILRFAWAQAQSCTFAFSVVGLLLISKVLPLSAFGVARYDFLLVGCLLVQFVLLLTRFETWREAGVIVAFHLLGFVLEAFKVAHGSWAYPEDALTKVLGVPLYAGFMYASVGSYMAQAWRRFQLRLVQPPPVWVQVTLAAAAYLNFFAHHYGPDFRSVVTGALLLAYWRAGVKFTVPAWRGSETGPTLHMPVLLGFGLIGFFVFLAENIATRFGAWVYPHQAGGWQPVHLAKMLSWSLMVVIAFLIVATLKGREKKCASAS